MRVLRCSGRAAWGPAVCPARARPAAHGGSRGRGACFPGQDVPHEGAAYLGRSGTFHGESGRALLCRHRVGGGRVMPGHTASLVGTAGFLDPLHGLVFVTAHSCHSGWHRADTPACEHYRAAACAGPAPGAEGKAGGRMAGGARAVGIAGGCTGPRNRSRARGCAARGGAGGAAQGLGARSRIGGPGGGAVLQLRLHVHARPRPQHSVTLVPMETFTPEFVEPRVHCVSSHGAFGPSR